ncbi:MAG TPA: FAD-binding oxidoreductase [Amaricoccus sp.]|uniref:FAD-binding oxidoreductase n=1 Tax=Amaricoccus sp. TaxID=1872485 RepID=UPI002C721399|nr:FAD-binding oxidoreductase [Amaricoccus sp.]HMQ92884.1 FAD-binding oxidoreductase [Amaricoccus sp.]HMR52404.1 FAD-binding oxidoreductase [Amaricoccus sp.]HMR59210.1 FAD-binding oxidoreductase [Amaricoccus sp.]HMT99325.1 FAD-binding oxidoreductase [Amaricoccus sp.]
MEGSERALVAEFGPGSVLTDPADMAPFLAGWFHTGTGAALAVLRPRATEEVRAMVRACGRLGLGIVPQGGNTGLVGGALPQDPKRHVALCLGRLDRIRAIEPDDYSAVVEAGCILQTVKDAVAGHDLFLPLSIGAQGTSQIGGVVSTNAGGINVLRYGMMREQVLGLEVVLADGSLWDGLRTLRKNNTGPDLKQLFIGAEGTFGIVTAAALRLVPRPATRASALIGLPDLEATMRTFHLARRACSDLLSAFEFLMPPAMEIAVAAQADAPELASPAAVYALIELAAPGPVDLQALLEGFLAEAAEAGLVEDGILATSEAQAQRIWALRESVNEGQARMGRSLGSDVSVRLSALPRFVREACAEIEAAVPGARAVAYGHFGDGNVHLNVFPPTGAGAAPAGEALARAKAVLNACVDRHGGSISAEHGIGRLKRADFDARLHEPARTMLRGLKSTLDPDGRMNPGALHV